MRFQTLACVSRHLYAFPVALYMFPDIFMCFQTLYMRFQTLYMRIQTLYMRFQTLIWVSWNVFLRILATFCKYEVPSKFDCHSKNRTEILCKYPVRMTQVDFS